MQDRTLECNSHPHLSPQVKKNGIAAHRRNLDVLGKSVMDSSDDETPLSSQTTSPSTQGDLSRPGNGWLVQGPTSARIHNDSIFDTFDNPTSPRSSLAQKQLDQPKEKHNFSPGVPRTVSTEIFDLRAPFVSSVKTELWIIVYPPILEDPDSELKDVM